MRRIFAFAALALTVGLMGGAAARAAAPKDAAGTSTAGPGVTVMQTIEDRKSVV